MLGTILIIVLILLLIGALPTWPYSSGWGYYPGGGIGLLLIMCSSWHWRGAYELAEGDGDTTQRMSFAHSSSVKTVTPSFLASASFEPAPGPATT
jgi:uncharacterized protein DUF3309